MPELAYRPDAAAVTERLRPLYERKAMDRIFAIMSVPHASPTLEAFRTAHTAGECGYPDPRERAEFWTALLAERLRVEDDSIPGCYLTEMDQGVYGGVLGGAVRWLCNTDTGWISSMVPRLLEEPGQLATLHFDPAQPFFKRYLQQVEVFERAARGRYGVCSLVVCSGLNYLFELLGATDAYSACLEDPELARRGIELGYSVCTAIQDAFFERVPLLNGGTVSLNFGWLPGRALMESVDPFHMASVAFFEEWGRPILERMLARYDGGEIHLHGNGRHLVEAVSTVRGLKAVIIGDDKGFPPGFEVLPGLRKRAGDMPLGSITGYGPFCEALEKHALPGGVLYHVWGAPSVDEANRTMEKVREYRV
ncbi:MAG: hypothetical protein ACYC6L_01465 [Anaerolineae bacterium]